MGPGSTHRTLLEVVVRQWPTTIFVPAVLLTILVLVVVTRICDGRDEARAAEETARARRAALRSAAGIVDPQPPPAPPRRWGRRTRCDCSWHTVGFAVGVVSPPLPRDPVSSGSRGPAGRGAAT